MPALDGFVQLTNTRGRKEVNYTKTSESKKEVKK